MEIKIDGKGSVITPEQYEEIFQNLINISNIIHISHCSFGGFMIIGESPIVPITIKKLKK